MKKVLWILGIFFGLVILAIGGFYGYFWYVRQHTPMYPTGGDGCVEKIDGRCMPVAAKPVIYLYPKKTDKVNVKLLLAGKLFYSYPDYGNGWEVTASPDGTIKNVDNREYSYLFWEAEDNYQYKMDTGFVVKGEDTRQFLQQKLSEIGLTPREYNEMIVYWLPKLEKNKYNLIHFTGQDYSDRNKLQITPKPDSMLRVYMVYRPLNQFVKIPAQTFKPFVRNGFSVVEWGGQEAQ